MNLRLSLQALTLRTLYDTRRQSNALADVQIQAATGKKLQNISDNPFQAVEAIDGNAQINRLDAHLSTLNDLQANLNQQVSSLQNASNLFSQARTLAIQASHSGNDANAFEAYATQVDQLINQLLDIANSKSNNDYLFGGTASSTQPYQIAATDAQGRPTRIDYQGTEESNAAIVSSSLNLPVFLPGNQVFGGGERSTTTYSGNTGAKPGTGTDSATGTGTLIIKHTTTLFSPGSGIKVGTSSPAGDTIIGPYGAHKLVIKDTSGNGTFGTISLDGGPAIAFSKTDTNLKITGPQGDFLYVNTTTITPGVNGTVNITARGSLSVDGGASAVQIDFSNNQQVVDNATGKVTFVDGSQIRRTGNEGLDYSGTLDAFQCLMALRDDLRNVRGLSSQDQIEAISKRLGDIDQVHNGILQSMGQQSSTLQTLDVLTTHYQSMKLTTQQHVSDIEDADLSELVIQQQANQNMLQLTLGTYAKILNINLMDYLR